MKSIKKLLIVLIYVGLFFACDNGAKEQAEKYKLEAQQAKKLAEAAEAKALKFQEEAERMAAMAVAAQMEAQKQAELAQKALEDCKGGK